MVESNILVEGTAVSCLLERATDKETTTIVSAGMEKGMETRAYHLVCSEIRK